MEIHPLIDIQLDRGTEDNGTPQWNNTTKRYESTRSLGSVGTPGGINTIQFDTAFADGSAEGRLQWNSDDGTLEFGMPGGNVNAQICQEMLFRVSNDEGATIGNGRPVLVNGATGNRLTVRYPDATVDADTFAVIALATEEISDPGTGYVTTEGYVRGDAVQPIDTSVGSGYTEGGQVFLGDDGDISPTPATKPNRTVFFGIVKKAHATEGEIWVKIIHLPMLYELSDVSISSLADNEMLQYNSGTGLWENTSTITGITLGTPWTLSGDGSWTGTSTLDMSDASKTLVVDNGKGDALTIQDSANRILQIDTGGGFERILMGTGSPAITMGYVTGDIATTGALTIGGNLLLPDPADIGSGIDTDLIQLDGTLGEVTVNGGVTATNIELDGAVLDAIKTSGGYTLTSTSGNLSDLSRTTDAGTVSVCPSLLVNTKSVLQIDTDFSGSGFGSCTKAALSAGIIHNGDISITGGLSGTENLFGISGDVNLTNSATFESGTLTLRRLTQNIRGLSFNIINNANWNEQTADLAGNFYGANISVAASPTIVGGSPDFTYYGSKIDVSTSTDGTSLNYGLYLDSNGADTNYGLYVNTSDYNIINGNVRIGDTTTPTEALEVNGNALIETTGNLYFRDTGLSINSSADGELDITTDGNITLGDGGTTNYANVASDGTITLNGAARVTKHLNLVLEGGNGANNPTPRVTEAPFLSWTFTVNDDSHHTVDAPHDMDYTQDMNIYVEWYTTDATAASDGDVVNWQITWNAKAAGEAVNAGATTDTTGDVTCQGQYVLVDTLVETIPGNSITADDIIGIDLTRIAAVTGTNPALNSIHVLAFHIEYTSNKLGE